MLRILGLFSFCLVLSFSSPLHSKSTEDDVLLDAGLSIEELRVKAKSGHAAAQFELALSLQQLVLNEGLDDTKIKSDPRLVEARQWISKAADQGDPEARNAYSVFLLQGLGGLKQEEKALEIMHAAAEDGSIGAMMTLSGYYEVGTNYFKKDLSKSYDYMKRAANSEVGVSEAGVPNDGFAKWRVGMMTLKGKGTEKDSKEAYSWFAKSSEAGFTNGMISRAVMLATGDGVQEDDVAARSWYKKAIYSGKEGRAHALRGLGYMLFSGEGGPVDKKQGIAYIILAEAFGDEKARKFIAEFDDEINKELMNEAIEIAQDWIVKNITK